MSRKRTIADAVVTTIQAITGLTGGILNGSAPRCVRVKSMEDAGINCILPSFIVYTAGIAETNPASRSMTDDIGYGIGVLLLVREDSMEDNDAAEIWREAMHDAFLNKRLTAVSQVVRCTIEAGPGLSEASPIYGMTRGNDIIRCLYQRART